MTQWLANRPHLNNVLVAWSISWLSIAEHPGVSESQAMESSHEDQPRADSLSRPCRFSWVIQWVATHPQLKLGITGALLLRGFCFQETERRVRDPSRILPPVLELRTSYNLFGMWHWTTTTLTSSLGYRETRRLIIFFTSSQPWLQENNEPCPSDLFPRYDMYPSIRNFWGCSSVGSKIRSRTRFSTIFVRRRKRHTASTNKGRRWNLSEQ